MHLKGVGGQVARREHDVGKIRLPQRLQVEDVSQGAALVLCTIGCTAHQREGDIQIARGLQAPAPCVPSHEQVAQRAGFPIAQGQDAIIQFRFLDMLERDRGWYWYPLHRDLRLPAVEVAGKGVINGSTARIQIKDVMAVPAIEENVGAAHGTIVKQVIARGAQEVFNVVPRGAAGVHELDEVETGGGVSKHLFLPRLVVHHHPQANRARHGAEIPRILPTVVRFLDIVMRSPIGAKDIGVVPALAVEGIASRAAVEDIVPVVAGERVVPTAAGDVLDLAIITDAIGIQPVSADAADAVLGGFYIVIPRRGILLNIRQIHAEPDGILGFGKGIRAIAAINRVVPRATAEGVVPAVAVNGIVATIALEHIVAAVALQRIIIAAADGIFEVRHPILRPAGHVHGLSRRQIHPDRRRVSAVIQRVRPIAAVHCPADFPSIAQNDGVIPAVAVDGGRCRHAAINLEGIVPAACLEGFHALNTGRIPRAVGKRCGRAGSEAQGGVHGDRQPVHCIAAAAIYNRIRSPTLGEEVRVVASPSFQIICAVVAGNLVIPVAPCDIFDGRNPLLNIRGRALHQIHHHGGIVGAVIQGIGAVAAVQRAAQAAARAHHEGIRAAATAQIFDGFESETPRHASIRPGDLPRQTAVRAGEVVHLGAANHAVNAVEAAPQRRHRAAEAASSQGQKHHRHGGAVIAKIQRIGAIAAIHRAAQAAAAPDGEIIVAAAARQGFHILECGDLRPAHGKRARVHRGHIPGCIQVRPHERVRPAAAVQRAAQAAAAPDGEGVGVAAAYEVFHPCKGKHAVQRPRIGSRNLPIVHPVIRRERIRARPALHLETGQIRGSQVAFQRQAIVARAQRHRHRRHIIESHGFERRAAVHRAVDAVLARRRTVHSEGVHTGAAVHRQAGDIVHRDRFQVSKVHRGVGCCDRAGTRGVGIGGVGRCIGVPPRHRQAVAGGLVSPVVVHRARSIALLFHRERIIAVAAVHRHRVGRRVAALELHRDVVVARRTVDRHRGAVGDHGVRIVAVAVLHRHRHVVARVLHGQRVGYIRGCVLPIGNHGHGIRGRIAADIVQRHRGILHRKGIAHRGILKLHVGAVLYRDRPLEHQVEEGQRRADVLHRNVGVQRGGTAARPLQSQREINVLQGQRSLSELAGLDVDGVILNRIAVGFLRFSPINCSLHWGGRCGTGAPRRGSAAIGFIGISGGIPACVCGRKVRILSPRSCGARVPLCWPGLARGDRRGRGCRCCRDCCRGGWWRPCRRDRSGGCRRRRDRRRCSDGRGRRSRHRWGGRRRHARCRHGRWR